ncbi:dermonecrotic toxin domain-containing protein [Pseudomonas mosselii]|uniref:dermonecrotic toxin domain-containing protein n=1 Tax=Pseudomonas mosselii TaxID=78327 RepID=UPI001F46A544|nr:DUF6543 domain-containing protein [Pseudomonas mosselii]
MSLQHFQSFDQQLGTLLASPPYPDASLGWLNARQHFFASLSGYWLETGSGAESRQTRLVALLRQQLLAQVTLRLDDHTLGSNHAELLETCVQMPLPWQRQHLPEAQRPQVYRPLLDIATPHWRKYLPGVFVIVEGGPEGGTPDPRQTSNHALLCSLSHGIEAFEDLGQLHAELCERLDDPQQSRALLRHITSKRDRDLARNAERLRYEWFNDDLVQAQAQSLIDGQHARLVLVWENAALQSPVDWPTLRARVAEAGDLLPWADSRSALQTRYGLLLERNSPAWLKNASTQGLTHIMQTLQELVIAIDQAAAPGILNHEQFLDEHDLNAWTCGQLRAAMRHQYQFDTDPLEIYVSVTLARQQGPMLHPGLTTGYVPVASRRQVGDTVELVSRTYRLDQLARLNIGWIDVDYWLTARVHRKDSSQVPQITPRQIKHIIRTLNVGERYSQYLRTHLLDSPAGQWRQACFVAISRARMRAEAAKARYAGHFLEDPFERGYRWTKTAIDHPDSRQRPSGSVRQWLINSHTVHGVLLVTPDTPGVHRLVVYTPDAPDRRSWREFRNARHLLRTLRDQPALREYVKDRVPLADRDAIERWLLKGGLAARVNTPRIVGDFQQARYRAEVSAALSAVDSATNTKLELLGEMSLHVLWITLDLLSLVLPNPALTALSFGRAVLSVLDLEKSCREADRIGVLKHMVEAFTHTSDGINSINGSSVVRRAIRGMPPTPVLKLPLELAKPVDTSTLRYRVDGIHKEGIYEQPSPYPGLTFYFIKNSEERTYQVSYDGYRWRVIDPRKPDAYTKVPVKRRKDGEWVVDSPLVWHDGLPDLQALLDNCRLSSIPAGVKHGEALGLYQGSNGLYLRLGSHALPLRLHLLDNHYHLIIAGQRELGGNPWAILRWHERRWQIRVRQTGRSSEWLELPPVYSPSLGSN